MKLLNKKWDILWQKVPDSPGFSIFKKIFKVTLKIFLWIIIGFVSVFILIAALIRIPVIQSKLVSKATVFVSSKTHTKVVLEKITISFPKSVVLRGIYLEDSHKDTLLFAGKIEINIAFRDLLRHRIQAGFIGLHDVSLNLSRRRTDSLFNFNFLITAFTNPGKQKSAEPAKKSNWTFSLGKISLKNIRVHYDDAYGGTNLTVFLPQLKLKMGQTDLQKLVFGIDNLSIDSLSANVLISKPAIQTGKKTSGKMPFISAGKIRISHSKIVYGDLEKKQSLLAVINLLQLKTTSLDVQKQIITSSKLSLEKSNIHYNTNDKEPAEKSISVIKTNNGNNNWQVSVKSIELSDNLLAYNVVNKVKISDAFDYNHMEYRNITLSAVHFFYSPAKTEVSIKKFTTIDHNDFAIHEFETDFRMDQHSISTQKFKLKTKHSSLDANLSIKFLSLKSLKDSIRFMIVNFNLKEVSFINSDVIYFYPKLARLDFFKNRSNTSSISGNIDGPINHLNGKNLAIQTANSTFVKTDFIITGLPSAKTAYFYFPNFRLTSGRSDIISLAASSVPTGIELPEMISVGLVFRGYLKDFESTVALNSSLGSAHLFAGIDKNENFRVKVNLKEFDVGRLLKNKGKAGTLSLTAEAAGHGLKKETVTAD